LTFIVRVDFAFNDGFYSGYDPEKRKYDRHTWDYEIGPDGFAKTDPTLENPRCVYQLMKQHYARYTPEMVERVCGTPKEKFLQIAELMASTATPTRAMTIMYALGWTQHSVGSQMIRQGAMVQLLLGNIGVSGGGMNALRGHSNIQGLTDLGLMTDLLPGYMNLPPDKMQDYKEYMASKAFKPLRQNQLSYWQNYDKFFVSLMKTWWGDAATAENNWAYDYLPKIDKPYDMLQFFELMHQDKVTGFICQGFNPLAAAPNKAKLNESLAKLKFLIVMDPLATETSEFWRNFGEHNDVDPAKIQTEVFRLPTNCFAEENGSLTNSSRWLQWHWQGAPPPGQARSDLQIMAGIFTRMRAMYRAEGGAFPDPILNLTWAYARPDDPAPEELAREYSGKALKDLTDPKDPT
jgi:formate dehydrogenase major subunit